MSDQNTITSGAETVTATNTGEQNKNTEIKETTNVQAPNIIQITQEKFDEIINSKYAQGAKKAEKNLLNDPEYQNYLNNKDKFNEYIESNSQKEQMTIEEVRKQLEEKHQKEIESERSKNNNFAAEMKQSKLENILTSLNVRVDKDQNGNVIQDYRKVIIDMLGDKIQFDLDKRDLIVNDEKDLISSPKEYIEKFVKNYSAFINPSQLPGLGKDKMNFSKDDIKTDLEKGNKKDIFNSLKNKIK